MKEAAARVVRLSEYTPFSHLVDHVALTVRLDPRATRVVSKVAFRPNPEAPPPEGAPSLRLDGEGPRLIRAAIDGAPVEPEIDAAGLTCAVPEGAFVWEAEVEIDPSANTALEGLYMSNGMYCTQCEAEGFRRITFYPDRPDVMAPFRVRIEGDLPVLLSNGNPGDAGPGHAEWDDPHPKPAYLFALVAGDLRATTGAFRTSEGRDVALNVWVRPGDEAKTDYAMDALERSMRWDEEAYGRAYDLDVFNIVAVDDFNMGAMENKGLNVFNSKYVLASPETATDRDFALIEAIVAHEYFHNWTGNRITCRDWFQLCLKEGLTVFRDRQFTGDTRSHAVKRIEDAQMLRARQFREDNGPLSHPVRPESYIEINNFYTATVYEKGAEVIGMLKRIVGDAGYDAALDLYFERHDGQACTIEDWLAVFEDATKHDLGQFKRWYTQSGTPRVRVTEEWADGTFTLRFSQRTEPTPGQREKAPQVIPIALGLLGADGTEVEPTRVVTLDAAEGAVSFRGLDARPVASVLRGFSAPVILERTQDVEERVFLLAHDTDPFNRWDAGRVLAREILVRMAAEGAAPGPAYLDAMVRLAGDEALDPAFRALALSLPGEDDVAEALHEAGTVPDPAAIHAARDALTRALAGHGEAEFARLYEAMAEPGPYTPDARSAGRRALRGRMLGLLSWVDGGARATRQVARADNMTEELAGLGSLLRVGMGEPELAGFEAKWRHDRLVMDKWFAMQVAMASPGAMAARVEALTRHPDFDWRNPNRFRAVMGAIGGNHAGLHHVSGQAYALLADWLIRLDPVNPQTAARMTTIFETWRRYDAERQGMMRAALERIAAVDGLSRDTAEMVARILGEDG